jgi:hypothetical protein
MPKDLQGSNSLMYATQNITSYCNRNVIYAAQGSTLIVHHRKGHVCICENEQGVMFPCHIDKISETAVNISLPEVKERKKPESKKPLTQAEKLQLEYLNSLK